MKPRKANSYLFLDGGESDPQSEATECAKEATFFCGAELNTKEDITAALNSNKDNVQLQAMKKVIAMVARGRDASGFFPAVVKNVVSKNSETRKLVYLYLERFAEEHQETALLSIAAIQRALKEPNQLSRATALRVLANIKVPVIAPIALLAIQNAATDMSSYVRKVAAYAIPKLYDLDLAQKPRLVPMIGQLLEDEEVQVMGAAVVAFAKVCPESTGTLKRVFHKLCKALLEIDEWVQVVLLQLLTRLASKGAHNPQEHHKALLNSARPLLQSRNAAVVMSVAQLFYYTAPESELGAVAKALVRLVKSRKEVKTVVLHAIATLASENEGMFEPFVRNFFVSPSEPTTVKLLKLDILTSLTSTSNAAVIMQEFQAYIRSSDSKFVLATIQAIGQCFTTVSGLSDLCLKSLVSLLSIKNENVVAESVVVIRRLLQTQGEISEDIVLQMVRLLGNVTVPQARAAILWLLGEYCDTLSETGLKVLKRFAKTFSDESPIVKLQVLNLAVKLAIKLPEESQTICQYLFTLAKYDEDYDIRDRARLLRGFLSPTKRGVVFGQASRIFLTKKTALVPQANFENRNDLRIGTLSHYLNTMARNYEPLPEGGTVDGDDCEWDELVKDSSSNTTTSSLEDLSSPTIETSSESSEQNDGENDKESEPLCSLEARDPINNVDMLLEIESDQLREEAIEPIQTPSPKTLDHTPKAEDLVPDHHSREMPLLDRMNGRGLMVTYRFTRKPHLYATSMANINLVFTNTDTAPITDIKIDQSPNQSVSLNEFGDIPTLNPECSLSSSVGIDFDDSTKLANFKIVSSAGSFCVSIKPTMGELLSPVLMDREVFLNEKRQLRGMHEHSTKVAPNAERIDPKRKVFEAANLAFCPCSEEGVLRFSGRTLKFSTLVLVTVLIEEECLGITVNCEKIVIGSILLNELKSALQ